MVFLSDTLTLVVNLCVYSEELQHLLMLCLWSKAVDTCNISGGVVVPCDDCMKQKKTITGNITIFL